MSKRDYSFPLSFYIISCISVSRSFVLQIFGTLRLISSFLSLGFGFFTFSLYYFFFFCWLCYSDFYMIVLNPYINFLLEVICCSFEISEILYWNGTGSLLFPWQTGELFLFFFLCVEVWWFWELGFKYFYFHVIMVRFFILLVWVQFDFVWRNR